MSSSSSSSLDEKCLYVCTFEIHHKSTPRCSYVVRSIKLSDLLSSSSSSMSELKQVAILEKDDFQHKGACGVFGSKIVFASGVEPAMPRPTKDVYAFDVHDPNQGIVKMPPLNGAKFKPPLITEFAGKLYVLSPSLRENREYVSFEVFDPDDQAFWSRLPKFPHFGGNVYSCAIAGSKLFASIPEEDEDPVVFCFDLAASDPKWKKVVIPRMCQGGSLPFTGQALVVDLPEQPEHKLLFSLTKDGRRGRYRNSLVVHLMSVVEGKEDVTQVMMEMPLPGEGQPRLPADCCLVHLGGNHVCLVNACIRKSYDPYLDPYGPEKPIDCTLQGAAIPFQFEFDISKVDNDTENCCTVQFLPSFCQFEYHLRPDSTSPPRTFGCFVL